MVARIDRHMERSGFATHQKTLSHLATTFQRDNDLRFSTRSSPQSLYSSTVDRDEPAAATFVLLELLL